MLLLVLFFAPKKRTEWGLGASPQQGMMEKLQGKALLKWGLGYPKKGLQGGALLKKS